MDAKTLWSLYQDLLNLIDTRTRDVKPYPIPCACASAALAHIRAAAEIHVSLYEDLNAGK
jgi:hypothetical protein